MCACVIVIDLLALSVHQKTCEDSELSDLLIMLLLGFEVTRYLHEQIDDVVPRLRLADKIYLATTHCIALGFGVVAAVYARTIAKGGDPCTGVYSIQYVALAVIVVLNGSTLAYMCSLFARGGSAAATRGNSLPPHQNIRTAGTARRSRMR
jgi:hypothetical protein